MSEQELRVLKEVATTAVQEACIVFLNQLGRRKRRRKSRRKKGVRMIGQDVIKRAIEALDKIGKEFASNNAQLAAGFVELDKKLDRIGKGLERHNELQELAAEKTYVDAVVASINLPTHSKRSGREDKEYEAWQTFAEKIYRTIDVEGKISEKKNAGTDTGVPGLAL